MQPSSQMLKGILEGAILRIIQQGDIYGYGLHEKLGTLGFGNIPEGTIYQWHSLTKEVPNHEKIKSAANGK